MGHSLSPLFSWRSSICDSDLPPTARHVALTLSLHMNERGESCFPTVATLVGETGLCERTVRDAIRLLGESGWLTKEVRYTPVGRQTSNLYTASVPELRGAADAPSGVQQMQGEGAADAPSCIEDVNRGRQEEDEPPLAPRERGEPDGDVVKSFEQFWATWVGVCSKRNVPAGPRSKAAITWGAQSTPSGLRSRNALGPNERAAAIENLAAWETYYEHPKAQIPPHAVTWLNQRRWETPPPDLDAATSRPKTPEQQAADEYVKSIINERLERNRRAS